MTGGGSSSMTGRIVLKDGEDRPQGREGSSSMMGRIVLKDGEDGL